MSTTIKELKNLTDLMTDPNLELECDIGFENIKYDYFQVEIYSNPENYHSVQFNMNMKGEFYFRSESGGIHITDLPIKDISLSPWSLEKISEYFDKIDMSIPCETAVNNNKYYSLRYFIDEILPLVYKSIHSSMK